MSLISLLLVAFLCIPSIVKISHALNEHKDTECALVGELHMHEVELDCDFHDFNLSPQYTSSLLNIPIAVDIQSSTKKTFHYNFLSKYQKLHFALRAPPIAS